MGNWILEALYKYKLFGGPSLNITGHGQLDSRSSGEYRVTSLTKNQVMYTNTAKGDQRSVAHKFFFIIKTLIFLQALYRLICKTDFS